MNYLNYLDQEEIMYLEEHKKGLISKKTDKKLLKKNREKLAYNRYLDEIAIVENNEKYRHLFENQEPLF